MHFSMHLFLTSDCHLACFVLCLCIRFVAKTGYGKKSHFDGIQSHLLLQKLKDKDLGGWQNIRGPRPWEDSRETQDQQRSRLN